MLNNEEKLEQEKTDEVKASSSLVSDTENSDCKFHFNINAIPI